MMPYLCIITSPCSLQSYWPPYLRYRLSQQPQRLLFHITTKKFGRFLANLKKMTIIAWLSIFKGKIFQPWN